MPEKQIDPQTIKNLNLGLIESKNLSENLAIDLALLLSNCFPELKNEKELKELKNYKITKKMPLAAEIMHNYYQHGALAKCLKHQSDTIRSLACFLIASFNLKTEEKFNLIKPLADDTHFGVREWAWLVMRPDIESNLSESIKFLEKWALESSPNLRRYASEALRPCGVWTKHLKQLKENPSLALKILEILKEDEHKYVQDSVGNWLNDASKSQSQWVINLCKNWEKNKNKNTLRICQKALRTVRKEQLKKKII